MRSTKQLNLTSFTVNAPVAGTYYWRIDSCFDGNADGTPVTGDVFNFIVILDTFATEYAGPSKPFEGQDFEIAGFVLWQACSCSCAAAVLEVGTWEINP